MNHSEKVKAIQSIRPDAEFILDGLELKWLDKMQIEPTESEIEAAWTVYQAKENAAKAEAEAAKASAQAKLAALGLTADEIAALSK